MRDHQHMTDGISASLEAEAVTPAHPCPTCGAESRDYGEAPLYDDSDRICSAASCRKVQPAPQEVESDDGSPRFPCAECGRETKEFRSGKIEAPKKRVCSNDSCGFVFDP
jgi:predicted RNA-binding Zn-ribbon protein involved in translation (DUF1610 family)